MDVKWKKVFLIIGLFQMGLMSAACGKRNSSGVDGTTEQVLETTQEMKMKVESQTNEKLNADQETVQNLQTKNSMEAESGPDIEEPNEKSETEVDLTEQDNSESIEEYKNSDEYRYRIVLNECYQAFSEDWDRGRIAEAEWVSFGCSYVEEKPRLEHIGYCFMDMNHDGNNELLIGEIVPEGTGYEFVSGNILSMFTIIDGNPAYVLDSWPRSRNYLWENGLIYNEGSGSGCSNYTIYSIVDKKIYLAFQEGIIWIGGNPGWYRVPQECYDYMEGCIPLSDEEAAVIIDQYKQKIVWPEYQPFSGYKVIP